MWRAGDKLAGSNAEDGTPFAFRETITGPLATVGSTCESEGTDRGGGGVGPVVDGFGGDGGGGDLALSGRTGSGGESEYYSSGGDGGTSRVVSDGGTVVVVCGGVFLCCDDELPRMQFFCATLYGLL